MVPSCFIRFYPMNNHPEEPIPPPSRIVLERFILGEKHFPSEAAYEAWKALPWWRRLFS